MKIPYFFEMNIIRELVSWCLVAGGGSNQDIAFFKLLEQYAGLNIASNFFNEFSKKDSSSRLEIALNTDDLGSKKFKSLCDSIRFLQNYNYPKNFKYPRSAEETFNKILEKTGILYSYNKRYSLDDKVALLNAAQFNKMIQDYVYSNSKKNSLKHFNSYIDSLMTISKDRAKYPEQLNKSFGVTIDTIHGYAAGYRLNLKENRDQELSVAMLHEWPPQLCRARFEYLLVDTQSQNKEGCNALQYFLHGKATLANRVFAPYDHTQLYQSNQAQQSLQTHQQSNKSKLTIYENVFHARIPKYSL